MKTKTIIFMIATCALLMAWGSVCFAEEDAKLIVFISPENAEDLSANDARALFDRRLIPAENRLAKEMQERGFQVMTSSDVVPTGQLAASEIAKASQGELKQIRKAAIANSAHYIFSGYMDVETTEEDTLGMILQKVVATISYKVYETTSAEVLHIDSGVFTVVGKSPKTLFSSALDQMAAEVSTALAAKISPAVSKKQGGFLADLKRKMTTAEVAPDAAPAKGGGMPQIVIINPPIGRGFAIAQKERAVEMEGMVIDHSGTGIQYFNINREPVHLQAGGEFKYGIMLDPGDNHFEMAAMSRDGKMVEKEITLTLPDDKNPPDIIITEPMIARGFTTVVTDPLSSLIVKGRAKDSIGVQYVTINDNPVATDENGHFEADIPLAGEKTPIRVVAADIFGNIARKEFHVERGQRSLVPQAGEAGAPAPANAPVLWGLAIGVSQYSSSTLDLKYAAADAAAIAHFFENQGRGLFSEVNFKVLTDRAVTRDAIIENFASHLGQAGPDDVVFIFVAGHGIKHRQTGSYYFIPSNADHNNIVSRGLRMSDFEEAVKILSKNVNKVVIAMDTCHSGAMEVGLRSGMSPENLAETLQAASGLYVLSSSKAGEVSIEGEEFQLDDPNSGHGVFTYALITGMRGEANYDNDAVVSLNELFQFVSRTVPRLTGGSQHPYLKVSGTDMPLVLMGN
ncbi:MAG: caspase family protein [Desulfosalsimonadaceae bacterium]